MLKPRTVRHPVQAWAREVATMDARGFGRLVAAARREGGYSKSELARRLGRLPDSGRVFDAAGITRIERGGPVRVDRELVDRLITVLGLDPFDAYEAADLRPEGFTADDHRDFVAVGGTRVSATAGTVQPLGTMRNKPLRPVRTLRAA
jgi:transcriptional regulator with XRE-family HTH domain